MKRILIIVILLACGLSGGGYYYYQHFYVNTLKLSEIVGHSDNPIINIAVSLSDFNTGLTRHDIQQLKTNKDYWIERIKEADAITDPDLKEQANTKLLSDMMEDPALKKIGTGILNLGSSVSIGLIKTIL